MTHKRNFCDKCRCGAICRSQNKRYDNRSESISIIISDPTTVVHTCKNMQPGSCRTIISTCYVLRGKILLLNISLRLLFTTLNKISSFLKDSIQCFTCESFSSSQLLSKTYDPVFTPPVFMVFSGKIPLPLNKFHIKTIDLQ